MRRITLVAVGLGLTVLALWFLPRGTDAQPNSVAPQPQNLPVTQVAL